MYNRKELTLYFTNGTADKFYTCVIQKITGGFEVFGINGRRGSKGTKQLKSTAPVTYRAAELLFDALVEEKRKKRYTTDISGEPGNGIDFSQADTQPLTVSVDIVAPHDIVHLQPQAWISVSNDDSLDTMLDDSNFCIQGQPEGVHVRLLARGDGVTARIAETNAHAFVPEPLLAQLQEPFQDYVLDGYFAAGIFTICDGYSLKDASVGCTSPFKARIDDLVAKVDLRLPKTAPVRVAEAIYPPDVHHAMYGFHRRKSCILIRDSRAGYRTSIEGHHDVHIVDMT